MAHELEEERQRRDKREDKLDTDGKAALEDVDGAGGDAERAVGLGATVRPRMSSCATQTGRDDDGGISPALLTPPAQHLDQYGTGFPILEPVPSGVARSHHSAAPTSRSTHPRVGVRIAHGIWVLIRPIFQSPPCVALLSALIISLVPTLRALFVAPKDGASFHPTAPDGDPPLAVLYDTAQFVGGASIPTGLVVLGASMGKLQVPRPIGRLPLASIVSMSVIRLVIQPIVGFFLVRELVNVGMVSAENKVLRFGASRSSLLFFFPFPFLLPSLPHPPPPLSPSRLLDCTTLTRARCSYSQSWSRSAACRLVRPSRARASLLALPLTPLLSLACSHAAGHLLDPLCAARPAEQLGARRRSPHPAGASSLCLLSLSSSELTAAFARSTSCGRSRASS